MRFFWLFTFLIFSTGSMANAKEAPATSQQASKDLAPLKADPKNQAKTTSSKVTPNSIPAPTTQKPPSQEDRPTVTPQLNESPFTFTEALVAFVKTILMLLVVLLIAYLVLAKGLPKLMNRSINGSRMKILERLPLDQKRTLFLVEVDGKTYLLGGADGQVSLIDRGDASKSGFEQKLKIEKAANDIMKEVG